MSKKRSVKKIAFGLALSAVLGLPQLVLAAGGARIDFAVGQVVATTSAGGQRKLAKGAEVVSGETVRTAADGRAQLRFDDGALVSLQPESEFRLDNYHFAGKQDGQERGFFGLLKGGLRTITGLIGRNNRDAYKISTSVATIGIRGTEFSLAYNGRDGIVVATGEGVIEVCNGAGCSLLSSGESAEVKGPDQPLQKTAIRPSLPPAQPDALLLARFSTAEDRNADGSVRLNNGLLSSGPGYSTVWAQNTSVGYDSSVAAVIGSAGELQSFVRPNGDYIKAVQYAESGSSDGVVGWGRWASAVDQSNNAYTNFHYLIGHETVGFAGITATYNLIGSSNPTSTNGNVGSALTGNLVANLSGGVTSLQLSMNVPINSTVYNVQGITSTSTASFSFANLTGAQVYSGDAKGAFYGVDASHAGVSYQFMTSGYDYVSGVATFKR